MRNHVGSRLPVIVIWRCSWFLGDGQWAACHILRQRLPFSGPRAQSKFDGLFKGALHNCRQWSTPWTASSSGRAGTSSRRSLTHGCVAVAGGGVGSNPRVGRRRRGPEDAKRAVDAKRVVAPTARASRLCGKAQAGASREALTATWSSTTISSRLASRHQGQVTRIGCGDPQRHVGHIRRLLPTNRLQTSSRSARACDHIVAVAAAQPGTQRPALRGFEQRQHANGWMAKVVGWVRTGPPGTPRTSLGTTAATARQSAAKKLRKGDQKIVLFSRW